MEGYHVAAVGEEPPFKFGPDDSARYEMVWWVSDETGEVHHGEIVDTVDNMYATVHLIPDPETGKLTPMAGTDWMPIPDDEE